jgi:hypothetical protein
MTRLSSAVPSCMKPCAQCPANNPSKWVWLGARSTRSQLPGETDNEDESDFLDVPDEMLTRSRPGSAPHVLVRLCYSCGCSIENHSFHAHTKSYHCTWDAHARGLTDILTIFCQVPVEESLSNSLLTDENISPKRDEHLLDSHVEVFATITFCFGNRWISINT